MYFSGIVFQLTAYLKETLLNLFPPHAADSRYSLENHFPSSFHDYPRAALSFICHPVNQQKVVQTLFFTDAILGSFAHLADGHFLSDRIPL
jgi:hypothetical protein